MLLIGLPPLYLKLQDVCLFLSIAEIKERPYKTASYPLMYLSRNIHGFYNGPSL